MEVSPESMRKVKKRTNAIWLTIAVGLVVVAAGLYTRFYRAYPYKQLKAFRVPSASMCPMICENERIFAAMDGYWRNDPRRGDIVMMQRGTSDALFIKRVIGVAGDAVSTSGGQILVNGEPVTIPLPEKGCQNSVVRTETKEGPMLFALVKVPPSSFFVVGDNLSNSYDSRVQGFGFVTTSQIRGKPLFIYWSPNSFRIGCSIR